MKRHLKKDRHPLTIWRVYGRADGWCAVRGFDPSPVDMPLLTTVPARTEAEAISRVFHLVLAGELSVGLETEP